MPNMKRSPLGSGTTTPPAGPSVILDFVAKNDACPPSIPFIGVKSNCFPFPFQQRNSVQKEWVWQTLQRSESCLQCGRKLGARTDKRNPVRGETSCAVAAEIFRRCSITVSRRINQQTLDRVVNGFAHHRDCAVTQVGGIRVFIQFFPLCDSLLLVCDTRLVLADRRSLDRVRLQLRCPLLPFG